MTRASLVLLPAVALLAALATGCGSQTSTCGPIELGGTDAADVVVASVLPLQGPAKPNALRVNAAIRAALDERDWRIGRHTVGFQACDDATADGSDPRACSRNANELAGNPQVLGVIGPLESECAQVMIPVLNQAPDGGVVLVSPTNTYGCLTRAGPGCDITEPDKYYPSGVRSYVRLAVPDEVQGAALAELAARLGVRSVFVLDDREAYGVGLAASFRRAARVLGIAVAGSAAWDPGATSYTPLFERIRRTHADAVFLGGLRERNGARLLRDKVAVLGANGGDVKVLAPDGFASEPPGQDAGRAAAGMYVSVVGQRSADQHAVYGALAADVLLTAIERSDGSRPDVIAKTLAYADDESPLGPISFDHGGDVRGRGAYGITLYVVRDGLELDSVVTPTQATLDAALGA
jgi:branched-chain amino acid transport system substrate-binding protein